MKLIWKLVRPVLKFLLSALVFCSFFLLASLAQSIYYMGAEYDLIKLPDVRSLKDLKPLESSFVYASDGTLIGCYAKEYRTVLLENEIPQLLERAILASEDQRFDSHWGLDFLAILRAAFRNLKEGRVVEGGSTLTQQVAKNFFLTQERTLERKIKEAVLALKLERAFSKREILTFYVNVAYLGRGRYGFEAASMAYFGKPVNALKPHEIALVVGLINTPDILARANIEAVLQKRNRVLQLMKSQDYLSEEDFKQALSEPLNILPPAADCKNEAPFFVEEIRKTYKDKLPLLTGGLRIYTTLDRDIQKKAEEALKNMLDKYRARHPENAETVQGAVIALDLKTGEMRAMAGGENFLKNEFNKATQAKRQPGSAFKPFTYAAGLKYVCKEAEYNKCVVKDAPYTVSMGRGRKAHTVENYPYKNLPRYRGWTTMNVALYESRNAATVWLAAQMDMSWILDLAHRAGIKSELQPYITTSIGASEVTLLEITAAFISFVNGGYSIEPSMIGGIYDANGKAIILPQDKKPEMVFSNKPDPDLAAAENARIAENMKELLKEVVDAPTGTAHGLRKTLPYGEIAGKTGTATNEKDEPTDNWFIGLTPKYAIGVWMGLENKLSLGDRETGAVNPLWVFEEIVRELNLLDFDEKFTPLFATEE